MKNIFKKLIWDWNMWILLNFLVLLELYLRHPPQVSSSFILFTRPKLDEFLPTNNDKAELKKANFVGLFSGITGRRENISPSLLGITFLKTTIVI